ncbi:hypothetical protein M9H77_26826 [Catharanthus roseus]|uniref:Uncharacterized protein n=1 Tax=Catharanthus roseus TaxID=4058 RepID=A0ACC0AAT5_CATRO|nr:hypothetical protein M9H77_26826 [Catharanthus roseus]
MEYNLSNPSWKRMEVKSKEEDHHYKFRRDMHNFHHGGGMDLMLMVETTMEMETSLLKDMLEFVASLLMLNLWSILLMMIMGAKSYGEKAKRYGEKQLSVSSQGVAKVETLKPSMIEEFSKVNELPQAQEVVEEEKERVEEKERLVERLCIFDSVSIISKESEHIECSKEKESEFEKSVRVKQNECFIEKQESEKEEQREKEIVVLEKGIKDKGCNMGKKLGSILEELPISLSLNPPLMCYEVSLVGLKFFLESYLSHMSIYEDFCSICFGGGLFLVVSYTSKYVSYYDPLKNQLVNNDVNCEPSCFGHELVHDDSFFDVKVGGFLEFNCASFDVLHDTVIGKSLKHARLSYMKRNLMDFIIGEKWNIEVIWNSLLSLDFFTDLNRMSQSPMELKLGPITRAQRRKLKILKDNGKVAYMEKALKSKLEGFDGQERGFQVVVNVFN